MSKDTIKKGIKIFYCYARKDKGLRDELERHLASLKRSEEVISWYDREILPGTEWKHEIHRHLDTSDIILLLISPHFIQSDYCYTVEMHRALERHKAGAASVLPIIIRPCNWKEMPVSTLQALPKDGKPITTWRNRDQAFQDVVAGIQEVVKRCLSQRAERDKSDAQARIPQSLRRYEQRMMLTERLRNGRRRRGWSQAKLAELLGVTPITISRWEDEDEDISPSLFYQEEYCKVFEKSREELFEELMVEGDVLHLIMNTDPQSKTSSSFQNSQNNMRVSVEIKGVLTATYLLKKESVIVGRSKDADISIPHAAISRFVARILWRDDTWVIMDAGALYAPHCNGKLIDQHILVSGDDIWLVPQEVVLHFQMDA